MKKKTIIWIGIITVVIAGGAYFVVDMLQERTIMPATEYDETPKVENSVGKTAEDSTSNQDSSITGTKDSSSKTVSSTVKGDGKDVPAATLQSTAAAGRQLKPSDFHINHKLNARLRFSNFLNTFREGDYVTGKDLAIIYGNDKEINSVVRKIVVKYFNDNIDYIQRKNGELIINTVDQKPAITNIRVPLLIDMNLTINHGSKIVLGKTFTSKEKKFNNINMLPLDLRDIEIKQSDEAMPSKGYVSGDNFYVNYPTGLECYKLK